MILQSFWPSVLPLRSKKPFSNRGSLVVVVGGKIAELAFDLQLAEGNGTTTDFLSSALPLKSSFLHSIVDANPERSLRDLRFWEWNRSLEGLDLRDYTGNVRDL